MSEPERRRRRPAVACTLCRKRKIRCNREHPCNNCIRLKQDSCVYDNDQPRSKAQTQSRTHAVELHPAYRSPGQTHQSEGKASTVPSETSQSIAGSSSIISTPNSHTLQTGGESTNKRIRELEEQLRTLRQTSIDHPSPVSPPDPILETGLGAGAFFVHEGRVFGESQAMSRSVMHKTRLFGQSHWINGAVHFRDMFEALEPFIKGQPSDALRHIQRCKSLARIIKAQRAPSWPLTSVTELPSRDVCDSLIKCYLDTIEPMYRVLHIPSFEKRYEELWAASNGQMDKEFPIQVKLVLAIGAVTHDEEFSLRSSAIHWVYEAMSWHSNPDFKSKLNIQSLQTQILLLIARELVDVGGTLVWVSAGELLRNAIYLGLHRDPMRLPNKNVLAIELRRRLWSTILEVTLQSSLSAGGPPLIALEDFDTEPPSNFNDEDLGLDRPLSATPETFTSSSIAISLRKLFPVRLAIARFLNDNSSSHGYQEVLQLDEKLRSSYKTLRQCLHNHKNAISPSRLVVESLDFAVHRYLLSLHLPYFGASLHDSAYAFSRKVVVDLSLKIWCILHPSSSIGIVWSPKDTFSSGASYLERLALRGSCSFRITAFQVTLVIAAEIKRKLQEEDSLGPVILRSDLVSVLKDAKPWALRCIQVGETNMKGYLLLSLITAYIEGLKQQLHADDLGAVLVQAAATSGKECVEILSRFVAQDEVGKAPSDDQGQNEGLSFDTGEGWDLMITDSPFSFDSTELLDWVLNGDAAEVPSLW